MFHSRKRTFLFVALLLSMGGLIVAIGILGPPGGPVAAASPAAKSPTQVEYRVIAWNDLGMHCYNPGFQELAVLPPWNTLYAQVYRIADPPIIVTTGVTVTFFFEDNTYSVGKTDFWDISPYRPVQNAQWLFGLNDPLPPNEGLTGVGLSGEMEVEGDHFKAEGIPLTEYSDSAPNVREPYQLATIVVYDAATNEELARVQPVAPVSTEMHCENCHYDGGPGNPSVATNNVFQNILTAHDQENADEYPAGYDLLMNSRPVLCAWCHASPILGELGEPGIPNFSNALHGQHAEVIPSTQAGCYNCHPGPETQCQRGVMFTDFDMTCPDCHGTLQDVANKTTPWFEEPRCDSPLCHGAGFGQDDPLYRLSKEHGGFYCEACHDSTHAIAPSSEPRDGLKFIQLQGYDGALRKCIACHASQPDGPGPHGLTIPMEPAWDKEVWIEGVMYSPGAYPLPVPPGGTVDVVDRVQVSGALAITYTLAAEWSNSLSLVSFQLDTGVVASTPDTLEWIVAGGTPDAWHTLTRTFAMTTVIGMVDSLTDTLTVEGRPDQNVMVTAFRPGYRLYLAVMFR
jgi:hypothetical protein